MKRRPNSPYTAAELAASFRYPALVSARAVGPDRIEAVFKDAKAAEKTTDPSAFVAFDVGPFEIESQGPGRARLRRRGEGAIDVIEIVEVSASDEWRRLMARELDVMSLSPNLYRDQFAGMTSVRLIDVPASTSATLYFNVRDPALADPSVRRRMAAALNRPAIARVAGGDESAAAPAVQGLLEQAAVLPARLSLLVVENESTVLLAASVLRHQLDLLNIAIDVEPVPLETLFARIDSGHQQLVLGPLPKDDHRFGRFVSSEPGRPSLSGLADPEYDAAVTAGDFQRAQAILDREMPATPLYEQRSFAAIDARFCGKVTPSAISWRWMADLYPCEDGKGEGKHTP
jgi:ABC-type oligopeptide transport system substrate-binding subunit